MIKPRGLVEVAETRAAPGESAEITSLVERAKAGDAEAFGDLVRLYERRVIAIGRQMGLSREDALDACQDAFVKVFRYIGRFRSGHSFYTWLYRIAVNTVYGHLKRVRRSAGVMVDETGMAVAADLPSVSTPFDSLESKEMVRRLQESLGTLSRRERIAFVLRDLQGLSSVEVGGILRLSQVTIRRHCMSARQKLRDRIFPPRA